MGSIIELSTSIPSFAYSKVQSVKSIFINPNIKEIGGRAFYRCVTYTQDEHLNLEREGLLEEIHLPYGINLDINATFQIGVDYNYLVTHIPSLINDKLTFYVYNPITMQDLFSIEYPIMQTNLFSAIDYPNIISGTFCEQLESKTGIKKIKTYNGFTFHKRNKYSKTRTRIISFPNSKD